VRKNKILLELRVVLLKSKSPAAAQGFFQLYISSIAGLEGCSAIYISF
jgi:hypothetical protein